MFGRFVGFCVGRAWLEEEYTQLSLLLQQRVHVFSPEHWHQSVILKIPLAPLLCEDDISHKHVLYETASWLEARQRPPEVRETRRSLITVKRP